MGKAGCSSSGRMGTSCGEQYAIRDSRLPLQYQPTTAMKKLISLPFFLLLTLLVSAQITPEMGWRPMKPAVHKPGNDFLFGLQVGVPSAEMRPAIKNRMGDVGFGAGLLFLSDPFGWGRKKRESALRLGGGLGYTYYGRFKTEARLNTYTGNLKTAYGIFDAKAIARFRPQLDRGFQPFADVQAGVDVYLSTTSEDLSAIESGLGAEAIDMGNTASASFSKGIGGGFAIGSRDPGQAKLVVRATYNWGSRVKYIVRNSLEYDPSQNTLYYQEAKAPVRYVQIQVGIGL